jgi:hypothetical protein
LIVVIGIVILILLARLVVVPKDFGAHERGYMYGWHNKANEQFWKDFKVKYQGAEYCKDCHDKNYASIKKSPHQNIECENCHGPAVDHPDNPPKLVVDKSRAQCLRCHYPLPYPTSGRAQIRGIDPDKHNPDVECSMCHNPHKPNLEGLR